MAKTAFSGRAASSNGPANKIVPVIPSDTADLPEGVTRGLFVGGAGTVRIEDMHGNVSEIVSAPHQYHPLRVRRISATGTDATAIIALY